MREIETFAHSQHDPVLINVGNENRHFENIFQYTPVLSIFTLNENNNIHFSKWSPLTLKITPTYNPNQSNTQEHSF